jgi:hypothetical protein
MMESVPSMAPASPPETGASSMEAPRSLTFSESSSVTTGEMVLMSTSSEPCWMPSSTPTSPATTSLTWGESGSRVMITSLCAATSPGLAATSAPPSEASSLAFSVVRLYRISSCPASMRFFAIGRPMIPSPMKPTFSAIVRLLP